MMSVHMSLDDPIQPIVTLIRTDESYRDGTNPHTQTITKPTCPLPILGDACGLRILFDALFMTLGYTKVPLEVYSGTKKLQIHPLFLILVPV